MTMNVRIEMRTSKASYNSLDKSVIYDFDCSEYGTFDEKRFIDEIEFACEWVNILNEWMQIEKFGIMKVKEKLNDEIIIMKFSETIWISSTTVTLIFSTKLMKQGYDRCSRIKTLMKLNTEQKIYKLIMIFNLLVMKYNEISEKDFYFNDAQTNSIQNKMKKTTSWTCPLCLNHCRPTMIDKIRNDVSNIEVLNEKSSKIVDCETCAVSKMHRIMQRLSLERATKSCQTLHFDLIIQNDQTFDDTKCIAHFTDEFISYSWIYPLTDYREKTLILIFRELINQCDRVEIIVKSMIRIIRTDQKIFIDLNLENWITNQEIIEQWSA
jgi:hypothetical protein